jgi:hypothetical protein
MEHRCGNRMAIDLPVRISTAGFTGTGVLRNLSSSGAFVETSLPLEPLSMVRVEVPRGGLRGSGGADARGLVVRVDAAGVGIEWCEVAPVLLSELSQPVETPRISPSKSSSAGAAQR